MTKISILFKPQKSWIAWVLQQNWFYEIWYSKLTEKKDLIKSKLKIQLDWVPFDKLDELYHNASNYFNEDAVIILMCRIGDLFEN